MSWLLYPETVLVGLALGFVFLVVTRGRYEPPPKKKGRLP